MSAEPASLPPDVPAGLSLRGLGLLIRETYREWNADNAPQWGAALAFYTTFSIAPLLIIIIGFAGFIVGKAEVQGYILAEAHRTVGPESAAALQRLIDAGYQPRRGLTATFIGLGILVLGALRVFESLRLALNTLWGVRTQPGAGVGNSIRVRLLSFAMILGIGLLLMLSLLVSAGLAALTKFLHHTVPLPWAAFQMADFLISLLVVTLLFAAIYKFLPDVRIAWSDVWIGAGVTALLFTAGKLLLGLYLGRSTVGSAYGAAGSLVVILVWVYYSAQIFFVGAEFTKVYARRYGSAILPGQHAVALNHTPDNSVCGPG